MPACESNEEVNMHSERMNLKCRRREKHFSPSYTREWRGRPGCKPTAVLWEDIMSLNCIRHKNFHEKNRPFPHPKFLASKTVSKQQSSSKGGIQQESEYLSPFQLTLCNLQAVAPIGEMGLVDHTYHFPSQQNRMDQGTFPY